MSSKANKHYDWMKLTTGGAKNSEYSKKPTKKKPKAKPKKGNIYDVVRERANRYKDL